MQSKSQIYKLVFITITLGLIFSLAYLFLVLMKTDNSSVFEGVSPVLALVLLAELTPVFLMIYFGAALILKSYYRQEKSVGGTMLLTMAILADAVLWYYWAKGSVRSDVLFTLFLVPLVIGICILIFLSVISSLPKSNTDE